MVLKVKPRGENKVATAYRNAKTKASSTVTPITDDELSAAMDQEKEDPTVIALAGKMDTNKSGVLCEFVSHLPDNKIGVILDFDHSIKTIIKTFYQDIQDKFFIINATTCNRDYKRGLLVAMRALEQTVQLKGDSIGLLASEGMDRLYQRSFKMTLQARGYNMEDLKFFGKGGDTEFQPVDWMIRNDYNVDPFDLLYNCARDIGVDLVLTTHTEDKINERREIIQRDKPIYYKTIPDYLSYEFIMTKDVAGGKTTRTARCGKSRWDPLMEGNEYIVSEKKDKVINWHGLYDQIKADGAKLHF